MIGKILKVRQKTEENYRKLFRDFLSFFLYKEICQGKWSLTSLFFHCCHDWNIIAPGIAFRALKCSAYTIATFYLQLHRANNTIDKNSERLILPGLFFLPKEAKEDRCVWFQKRQKNVPDVTESTSQLPYCPVSIEWIYYVSNLCKPAIVYFFKIR